ncbi:hypothetical protein J6590_003024 [Homalodisca vitripennis]|nr:hypothetical protein J6590_003024 [Homalodisca vitripennis]
MRVMTMILGVPIRLIGWLVTCNEAGAEVSACESASPAAVCRECGRNVGTASPTTHRELVREPRSVAISCYSLARGYPCVCLRVTVVDTMGHF